jgi:hypothetical protein
MASHRLTYAARARRVGTAPEPRSGAAENPHHARAVNDPPHLGQPSRYGQRPMVAVTGAIRIAPPNSGQQKKR